ncbi:MAG: hypothetical protein DMG57_44695 [Acidobacteria bacterium]|nr:MAG: hypothetical protein DMG57_44695 [Acidobacteriota bacterium]
MTLVASGASCEFVSQILSGLRLDITLLRWLLPRDFKGRTPVANRLLAPGSEFHVHRQWFVDSALDELETDFAVAEKDRLYRCLDRTRPTACPVVKTYG